MNYYICAFIITILSFSIFFIWKYRWIKGEEHILLYILLSLPLSVIVNIFIKSPIFSYLVRIFNIDNELTRWPIWFLTIVSVIGPLLEEGIKLLLLLILIKLLSIDELRIYLLGMLIGVGFGIGEAWYLGYSLAKSKPEYIFGFKNFWMLLLGFGGERIFCALLIHPLLTGMVAFGIVIKEPINYFFLAVLFHFLINIPTCLFQVRLIPQPVGGILTIIIFFLLFFCGFVKIEKMVNRNYGTSILQEKDEVFYEKKD